MVKLGGEGALVDGDADPAWGGLPRRPRDSGEGRRRHRRLGEEYWFGGESVDALGRPPRPQIKRRMDTQTGLSGLKPDSPV